MKNIASTEIVRLKTHASLNAYPQDSRTYLRPSSTLNKAKAVKESQSVMRAEWSLRRRPDSFQRPLKSCCADSKSSPAVRLSMAQAMVSDSPNNEIRIENNEYKHIIIYMRIHLLSLHDPWHIRCKAHSDSTKFGNKKFIITNELIENSSPRAVVRPSMHTLPARNVM